MKYLENVLSIVEVAVGVVQLADEVRALDEDPEALY